MVKQQFEAENDVLADGWRHRRGNRKLLTILARVQGEKPVRSELIGWLTHDFFP